MCGWLYICYIFTLMNVLSVLKAVVILCRNPIKNIDTAVRQETKSCNNTWTWKIFEQDSWFVKAATDDTLNRT